jgi:hypothetical protein
MLEIALSVALFLVTRDPRIVLMKPAFSTALAGLYLLLTCVVGRPFTFEAGKPFATRGEAGHERAYETAWAHSPGFRHEPHLRRYVQAQQVGDPEQPQPTAGRCRLAGRPTVATHDA